VPLLPPVPLVPPAAPPLVLLEDEPPVPLPLMPPEEEEPPPLMPPEEEPPVPPVPAEPPLLVPVPPALPLAPMPLVVSDELPGVVLVELELLPGLVLLVSEPVVPAAPLVELAPPLGVVAGAVVVVSSFLLHAATDSAIARPIVIQSCLLITGVLSVD
jgi:hypothetical protein